MHTIEGNFQRPKNLCIVWKINSPVIKPMKSLIRLLSFILEKRNLYYMHFFNIIYLPHISKYIWFEIQNIGPNAHLQTTRLHKFTVYIYCGLQCIKYDYFEICRLIVFIILETTENNNKDVKSDVSVNN